MRRSYPEEGRSPSIRSSACSRGPAPSPGAGPHCFRRFRHGEAGRIAYGLLILRVVVGATLFGHGAQKLFGWFGGSGPRATAGSFGALGFSPPIAMAVVAGLCESSGLLLALGLATPLACVAIAATMLVAIGSVHISKGFWVTNGGFEYNLMIWTAAVAIAATGPGRFSLDAALGWADNISGLWWGVGVAVCSALGAATVLATRKRQPKPESTETPLARGRDEGRERISA